MTCPLLGEDRDLAGRAQRGGPGRGPSCWLQCASRRRPRDAHLDPSLALGRRWRCSVLCSSVSPPVPLPRIQVLNFFSPLTALSNPASPLIAFQQAAWSADPGHGLWRPPGRLPPACAVGGRCSARSAAPRTSVTPRLLPCAAGRGGDET